jgi:predicted Zn-ribbon and HTH transcriptional regulator
MWTQEECVFLKEQYPEKGPAFCAEKLGRTLNSVKTKASRLGIYYKYQNAHSKIKQYSPKEGYIALEPYINSATKILHRHFCGYEWKVTPNSVQRASGCPRCSKGGVKLTHDEYIRRVPEYDVLENYVNYEVKILHRHKYCGYEWKARPHDVVNMLACPNCRNKGKAYLYLCYFPEVDLYKIGITKSWEGRSTEFGTEVTLISLEEFNSWGEAYSAEQTLLTRLPFAYSSTVKTGASELFRWPTTS